MLAPCVSPPYVSGAAYQMAGCAAECSLLGTGKGAFTAHISGSVLLRLAAYLKCLPQKHTSLLETAPVLYVCAG